MHTEILLMSNKDTNIIIFFTILAFIMYGKVYGQNVSIPDSIIVYNTGGDKLVFDYKVAPGNTVYSISKAFMTSVQDIYKINKELDSKPLSLGQVIKVPFAQGILDPGDEKKSGKRIYYRVGKKENLFRIAKIYFNKNVSELMRSNGLKDYVIHPGQILYIGNYGLDNNAGKMLPPVKKEKNTPKTQNPEVKKIVVDSNRTKREKIRFVKVVKDKEPVEEKEISQDTAITVKEDKIMTASDSGKAIWNRNIHLKGVFVLNNDAKLNSLMEIYNPLVDKKIYARVIGRIPPNTYPDNVIVILSPEAASELKAIDDSFFVRINYIKN